MGGIVGGPRTYDGPGMPGSGWLPWKCPACAVENSGSIDDGCVHCGSGSAKPRHVGQPPPAVDLRLEPPPRRVEGWMAQADAAARVQSRMAEAAGIHNAFDDWYTGPEELRDSSWRAFVAGADWAQARTMAAPPVAADVASLAPEGKARRTIIAALGIFKDQILRDATDEIASGEWCSIEETDALIQHLKEEEEP